MIASAKKDRYQYVGLTKTIKGDAGHHIYFDPATMGYLIENDSWRSAKDGQHNRRFREIRVGYLDTDNMLGYLEEGENYELKLPPRFAALYAK